MLLMSNIIAHAGEDHLDIIQSTSHALPWHLELSLFVGVMSVLTIILYKITKKLDLTILIISGLLLISGFGFYDFSPAISIVSISTGLIATLAVTLLGIGSE